MTDKTNSWLLFLIPVVAGAFITAGSIDRPAPEVFEAPPVQMSLGSSKQLRPVDVNIPINPASPQDITRETLGQPNLGTGGCSSGNCSGSICDSGTCTTGNCPGGACDGSGLNTEGIKEPAAGTIEQTALFSAVRIRIEHSPAVSKGSGTVIGITDGVATVLTCGHLFTEYQTGDKVNIDYHPYGDADTVQAKVIKYTFKPDLAVVEFNVPKGATLVASPLAPGDFVPPVGLAVFNWGCPGGSDPLLQKSRVTYINRYLGHQNIETQGRPEQGRSGSGLFDLRGRVLGVIWASEPSLSEGLSSGPKAINDFLDGLSLKGRVVRDKRASAKASAPATKPTIIQHTMAGCGPCFLDKRDVLPLWEKVGWACTSVEDNPPNGTYPWYEITDADGVKVTVVGRLTTEKFNAAKAKVSQK